MAIVSTAEDLNGRRRLSLKSPTNLKLIGEIEVNTKQDVQDALKRARVAQRAWGRLTVEQRVRYMENALSILLERQDEFVQVIMEESGKAQTEALMIEIFAACDALRHFSKRAPKVLKSQRRSMHGVLALTKKLRVNYRPLGVVGVISPWNGPFILSLNPTVQALLAGNAVLLKPSEVTPRSGGLVGELFVAAGLPKDLLIVLQGDGETGAALVEAGVDKITFTGSVGTGKKVAVACAEQLIPCTLELGGKDPMLVCEDANLDRAAAGAVAGAIFNTGQYCCGTERIYVVDSVADDFIEKVVAKVGELRQGSEGEFDVGAMFWQQQLELVESHVEDAIKKGARVLVGGRRNPGLQGLYFEPTVLVDVTHDMKIMSEETFGPVLPIMRVRDEEEGIELANDTCFGLSANVWSKDTARAERFAERIDSGSACVNDMAMAYGVLEAPFGGRKNSGLGQVNGDDGLRSYCFAQAVVTDRFGGKMTASHYPYSLEKDEGMKKFMRFLWGSKLGRWLS